MTRDITLKRLTFRSWHRGLKETDLLLGNFADRHLAELSDEELAQYAELIEEPDPEIFAWITGKQPAPQRHQNSVMERLLAFRIAPDR